MNVRPLSALVFAAATAFAGGREEPRPDLLRFANGDRLHGEFVGLDGATLAWRHEGAAAPVDFNASQIRQVVLRAGRPLRSQDSLSHVALGDGDRLPGHIVALDDAELTLDTSYAGTLRIPREQIAMAAPNPLGGRILYHGPFEADEWSMVTRDHPEGLPPEPEGEPADDASPRWALSGAAWYWHEDPGGTALVRRDGMADRSILRFNLAWRNRISLAIAFHADFARPDEEPEEEGEPRRRIFAPGDVGSFPELFGNAYVLHLHLHHLILFRTGFDADGQPTLDRLQTAPANVILGDAGEANVELRCNRQTGNISLLVNDEFVAQWSESAGEDYAGRGEGFGFVVAAEKSPVRLSDIALAEWNGMPDSARSLQVDDQDIVLLTNGTDRFSGSVTGIADGVVSLSGRYGDFRFPLADVAEIRFAKNALAPVDEASHDGRLGIRLHPLGRIAGKPLEGDASAIKMLSPALGEITVDLRPAVLLEFQSMDSFLDDWDPKF